MLFKSPIISGSKDLREKWRSGSDLSRSLFSQLFLTLSLSDTPSVKLMVNSSTLGTFSLFFSVWYSVQVLTTTCTTKGTYWTVSWQRSGRILLKMSEDVMVSMSPMCSSSLRFDDLKAFKFKWTVRPWWYPNNNCLQWIGTKGARAVLLKNPVLSA